MHNCTALLIPIKSLKERKAGLWHLLEHILVSKLISISSFVGYTSEDYIILFSNNKIYYEEVLRIIKKIRLNRIQFINIKGELINEILKTRKNFREYFFKRVWGKTLYQRSPLGNITSIKRITIADVSRANREIIRGPLYYFANGKVTIKKGRISEQNKGGLGTFRILRMNKMIIEGVDYNIYYFKDGTAQVYLLEKILQLMNKDRHIQFSRKLCLNALIIERGAAFPGKEDITKLKEKAVLGISTRMNSIKKDCFLLARNELESHYYYMKSWQRMIKEMIRTEEDELIWIICKIRSYGDTKIYKGISAKPVRRM